MIHHYLQIISGEIYPNQLAAQSKYKKNHAINYVPHILCT